MPQHARNKILDLAGTVGRVLAPVFFGKRPAFRSPISPRVSQLINDANLLANEVQSSMGQQAVEMLKAIQVFHDQATDLLGVLPPGEKTNALNQIQEVLDLPAFAYTEAWVKTLQVMIAANKSTIAAAKKRKGN